MKKFTPVTALLILFFILIGVSSFVWLGDALSDPATHEDTIAALDQKADTVLKLTAASTVASAGISALPGDTATPIAEKLADFSEYFLFILTVLYTEKYLLTIIGTAAFKIVIPAACLFFIGACLFRPETMRRTGIKLALLALVIYFTIPASIIVSDKIYDTYYESINTAISSAEELTEEAETFTGEDESGIFSGIINRVSDKAGSLLDKASSVLNRFIEALAVMIVTSCIIPLLVLVFFLWIIRVFTGASIPMPRTILPTRRRKTPIK